MIEGWDVSYVNCGVTLIRGGPTVCSFGTNGPKNDEKCRHNDNNNQIASNRLSNMYKSTKNENSNP